MGSDSMMKVSVPVCSKEFGKKKRTNRLAKLKQEKLDARREQWLSQAKNKGCKEESNGGGDSIPLSLPPKEEPLRNLETKSRGDEIDVEFITNSPINSVLGGNDSGKDRPGSSSGSCSSGSGCFSGSISEEEEEEEEEDGCLDDWEAVADALTAEDKRENQNSDPPAEPEASIGSYDPPEIHKMASGVGVLKPECKGNVPISEAKSRAWRPDDAFRPQSLPNLSKQHSFPMNAQRHCGRGTAWSCHNIISQPSSCPICFEDLDLTDSSFLPCSCGFRLCLFCHKRILEVEADDARCPGCRKQYAHINGDSGINGGASPFRLARSFSMNIRS
ncbi:zinc finger protein [Macleaya cordata]|uniref:Zinc finger protein n=1 Tax=Macleaya cordata TaxID=56857 RepID=A0A200QV25_MACCD|nr:zinc finger protein [Macleaya cordata]